MKHQAYFPRALSDRPEWYHNLAVEALNLGAGLGFTTGEINVVVADALYLEYSSGPYLTAVREFGPMGTRALAQLEHGTLAGALAMPTFTAPPLPAAAAPLPAVVPVAAGALARIFAWVQAVKTKPAYTDTIGTALRIIGPEDAATHTAPEMKLKLDRQGGQQVVRISFKNFGNPGVAVWSKRAGGAWELVAIVLTSPFTDERPLLTAGTPEVRDYRLQFFDGTSAAGDFSDVASVTVAP